jgi:chromate transport protein ChrA
MKKRLEEFLKETARDTLAIGGLAFYIMFIARAFIAPYYNYALQLIISLIIFQILVLIFKKTEQHIARALIAAIFTIIFYNVQTFTIFAIIIYALIFASAIYLKKGKIPIINGLILALISSGIGYYLTPLILP